jgi:ubiquinone/menaquinone biosynthesis C-methylase UbiE
MAEFDAYSESYEQTIDGAIGYLGKSQQFFTIAKADYLSELIADRFGAERKVEILDVGCGSGSIHPLLLERCPKLLLRGIDVASTSVEIARRAHPKVHYDVYDGAKLPYGTGHFDAAYTICVLHHVPPAERAVFMAEMRRVVRPGGMVGVIEHNPFNPLTQLLVNTCPFDRNAKLLRAAELKKLMRGAGLQEIKSRFIQFTPFAGSFFKRFDRWMGWLPFGAQYLTTARNPAASSPLLAARVQ